MQYAVMDYRELLSKNRIAQNMDRKGKCYDNACRESFYASMIEDRIHVRRFKNINEVKLAIVDYIETFYNCKSFILA